MDVREGLRPRRPWKGCSVLLGVTGGAAAYKTVQLARDLTRLGARVDVVVTRAARRFVRPLAWETVTGRPVHHSLWRGSTERGASAAAHLRLARDADVVVVAPATADLIARAAHGRADDLLTTSLLATRAPVVLCPAMNDRMYEHPQVQANLAHCRAALGYRVAGPDVGPLAWGEGEGPGRMLDVADILEHVGRALETGRNGADGSTGAQGLSGRRVLVTAGPTREPLDPVRYLGNRSSGRMGWALARAAWRRGAEVVLVAGPTELPAPHGVQTVRVETARDMAAAVRDRVGAADVVVFAAAVADWRPSAASASKLKKRGGGPPTVELEDNPDVARSTREARAPGAYAVGFALETEDLLVHARAKLEAKGFDLIVANEVGPDTGFGAATNRVVLVGPDGRAEPRPLETKDEVAEAVLDRVAEDLRDRWGDLPDESGTGGRARETGAAGERA